MAVRYLTVPGNSLPSAYAGSTANLRTLYGALQGMFQDVAINQAGEGFSIEYPNIATIGSFILNGGVYVDYCGEPFYYHWTGSNWMFSSEGPQLMQYLFSSIGANIPISTYFDGSVADIIFGCTPSYTFPRGIVTREDFLTAQNTTALGQYRSSCYRIFEQVYIYGAFGVKSPLSNGWYFYAFDNQNGAGVPPSTYAAMITKALGSSTGGGTPPPSGITCQSGYYWDGTQCVPSSTGGGGTTPGGGGTTPSTGLSTGAKIAIGVGGLALLGGIIMLTTGGD